MIQPLEGIRIIELGQIYAVPYCTLQLSYLGAEVIKVEPPGAGEFLRLPDTSPGGVNYAFVLLNGNKKSVTLNLKDERAREILKRLLKDADVVVENYRAGVMDGLGLGYDQLRQEFPRLIYASVNGYGAGSKWEKLGAMDFLVQASSGFISVTGYDDRPGVKTPVTFIDMGSGMHLAAGIMAALLNRNKTGRGTRVEVAMHDVAVPALTSIVGPVLEGRGAIRTGNRHRGACPCNIYRSRDGEIAIFCLTEPHWRALIKLMGREELLPDPRYKNHMTRGKIADLIDSMVGQWVSAQAREHLLDTLTEAGIPCSPVRAVEEVVVDPAVERRAMLREVEHISRGKVKVMGSPIKFPAEGEAPLPSAPRPLGADNAEVLGGVGISDAELIKLRSEGVI